MSSSDIAELYFQWLYDLACKDTRVSGSYHELFTFLHSVPFNYTLPMDENRLGDGENLRYRFASEMGLEDMLIRITIDTVPCSVLEMMMALAIRCEESFMHDPDIGDRTREWFWRMLANLGLATMRDGYFDGEERSRRIDDFINRRYDRDGNGGLFTVPDCTKDMRTTEIWAQMMLYLNTIIQY